ncbi:MAG: hypothetical protein MUO50_16975 [Longimicrobiales bacterium]|nr:hypothetical protein [Longimicrobiales bacterium]
MTRVTRRTVKFLAVGLVLFAVVPGSSLQRWVFGGGRGERELYMKLPLQQPRFHWYFLDEAALLSGSLEIAIHGASGRDTTLTVFSDGQMTPGWSPMSRDKRGIYFGFVGGGKNWTEPGDSLVVTLVVTKDLEGIGAYRKGILPKGRYRAVASYSRLTGHPDFGLLRRNGEPTASVSCWRSRWQLDVIEERGWIGAVTEEEGPSGGGWLGKMEKWALGPRGTDGFRCVE